MPELPLVIDFDAELEKTSQSAKLLEKLGVTEDIKASKGTRNIRAGKGK